MKQTANITDERLDTLLASLKDDGESIPDPPVVNPFRLEMERVRRVQKRQAYLITITAMISLTVTSILTAVCFRFFSEPIGQLLHSPPFYRPYLYCKVLLGMYSGTIAAALTVLTALTLSGYVLCGALMVKYRKRLFVPK